MSREKRNGTKPVPDNLSEVLNQIQIMALRQVEQFGWQLDFVRRPPFQEVTPVVTNEQGDRIGVIEEDGQVNMSPEIQLRG